MSCPPAAYGKASMILPRTPTASFVAAVGCRQLVRSPAASARQTSMRALGDFLAVRWHSRSFWKRHRAQRARCVQEAAAIACRDGASAGFAGHGRPWQEEAQLPSHPSCLPAWPSAIGREQNLGFARLGVF